MDTVTTVRCTINNCRYWTEGKGCIASEILITHDTIAKEEEESVDAPVASSIENTPAQTCMETCCKTFIPKGAPGYLRDDVSRREEKAH